MSRFLILTALAVSLAACGGGDGGLLDRGKRAPDEFAVYSRAPLTLPPDYGLRPPEPGKEREEQQPRETARGTLVGTSAGAGAPSGVGGYSFGATTGGGFGSVPGSTPATVSGTAGTAAILERSGAATVEPGIRSQVDRETTVLAEEDQFFTDRLIFWGTPTEYGTIVDPVAESRRIRENQALGRTITAGDTPTIERAPQALLEGLFN